MSEPPRLLIVSLDRWLHPVRLPRALADAGFGVEVCAFGDDLILASRHVARTYKLDAAIGDDVDRLLRALVHVLDQARPALVLPADDSANLGLERLHALLAGDERPLARAIADLIRRSKGDPAHYGLLSDKHRATALGVRLGLPVPAQRPCPDPAAARAFGQAHGWPLVLKSAHGGAGAGVRVCADAAQAEAGLAALKQPVMAQAFVTGVPTTFAGVALEGRLLAGTGYRKLETWNGPTGPGSVLEVEPHAGMRGAAAAIAAHVGLTGFFDLDFLLDAAGQAWFIECNARAVPATHVGALTGQDQARALHAALAGRPWAPEAARASRIALFPLELVRDAASPHLQAAWHDVPWDEPTVLRAYFEKLAPAAPGG